MDGIRNGGDREEGAASVSEVAARLAILFLVILVMYAGFILLRDSQPCLESGGALCDSDGTVYLVEGEGGFAAHRTYEVELADVSQGVEFLVVDPAIRSLAVQVRQGDQVVYSQLSDISNSRTLSVAPMLSLDGGTRVSMDLWGDSAADGTRVFVGSRDALEALVNAGASIRVLEMGLLFTMVVYGMTMFFFKRSERYMLKFALYAGLLFLETLLFANQDSFPPRANLFVAARTFLIVSTMLLSVTIGYALMGVRAPRWLGAVLATPSALAVSSVFAVLAFLFWNQAGSYLTLTYNVAAVLAAVYGCARAPRENVYVAAIYLVSIVACANGSLFRFLDLTRSVHYSLLFTAPLFNIPFVFVVMVAVNRRFALKFGEAETLNVELDQKVADRTQSLRETEAQRRQLMLNVFHDLRSPIFAIKGCAEFMVADPGSAPEFAPTVLERAEFMSRLTNDLFFLAKLEGGHVMFSEDPVEVGGLLDEAVQAHSMEARAREVRIGVERPQDPCWVLGDRQRIKQAVENVVVNAVTYTRPGTSVSVSLATDADEDGAGGWAHVFVADRGPGLSPEETASVFKRYYCKDCSPESKSTGVGLSIAEGIVKHTGGTIEVQSTSDEGTTFRISLPLMGEECG